MALFDKFVFEFPNKSKSEQENIHEEMITELLQEVEKLMQE